MRRRKASNRPYREASASIRLETVSRKCLCSLAVLFCVSVGLFVWAGITFGPKVYRDSLISKRTIAGSSSHSFQWDVRIRSMNEKHRNLNVDVEFRSSHVKLHFSKLFQNRLFNRTFVLAEDKYQIGVVVDVYGLEPEDVKKKRAHDIHFGRQILRQHPADLVVHCPEGQVWCNPATVLDFEQVKFAGYNIEAAFTSAAFGRAITEAKFYMRYGDAWETAYLIVFKYCFVAASALYCCWYTCALDGVPEQFHSTEQSWLQVLAILLIFFNDPLYLAEIKLGYVIFPILSVIFHTTFLAALLLFWLILLDHIRLEARERRINKRRFYPTKVLFVFVFWLLSVLVYCYNIEELSLNPAFKTKYNTTAFKVFLVAAVIAVVGYCTWIFVMVVLLFAEIRSLSHRFQFLLAFSLVMALMTLLAHPNMGSSTGFYAIFNLYTYILGYLYSPAPAPSDSGRKGKYDGVELMDAGAGDDDYDDGVLTLEMDTSDFAPQFCIDDYDDDDDDDDIDMDAFAGSPLSSPGGALSPATMKLAQDATGLDSADNDNDDDSAEDFSQLESTL